NRFVLKAGANICLFILFSKFFNFFFATFFEPYQRTFCNSPYYTQTFFTKENRPQYILYIGNRITTKNRVETTAYGCCGNRGEQSGIAARPLGKSAHRAQPFRQGRTRLTAETAAQDENKIAESIADCGFICTFAGYV
ncbi:MAG: hypothetical protein K2J51_01340, partial [Alistipes sp.]|nr:hypothetical protein [Alistipes sp.]